MFMFIKIVRQMLYYSFFKYSQYTLRVVNELDVKYICFGLLSSLFPRCNYHGEQGDELLRPNCLKLQYVKCAYILGGFPVGFSFLLSIVTETFL